MDNNYSMGEKLGKTLKSEGTVAGIMFVLEAQKEESALDLTTITEHAAMFPVWDEHFRGKRWAIVMDEGELYQTLHDIADASHNLKPSENPHMWKKIGNPLDEYPEWSQPLGADDAYHLGDKVTFGLKRWICDIVDGAGNNVWQPGVYGWSEVTE